MGPLFHFSELAQWLLLELHLGKTAHLVCSGVFSRISS